MRKDVARRKILRVSPSTQILISAPAIRSGADAFAPPFHSCDCGRSGIVVDQTQSDSWKVVPKRRRRSKPIVVDHSYDELIDNVDYQWFVNRFGEIRAKDAIAKCHDMESFKLQAFKLHAEEGEA